MKKTHKYKKTLQNFSKYKKFCLELCMLFFFAAVGINYANFTELKNYFEAAKNSQTDWIIHLC